jgi:hypothetical protein
MGSRTYTIVLHFAALEHLEQWLASEVWKRLILEVQHLLQDGDQVEIKTGLEFWFRPPDSEQKRAKPYKQFLITLSVIFPLTILVPWLLTPVVPCRTHPWGISDHPLPRRSGNRRADDLRNHAPLHTADGSLAIPLEGQQSASCPVGGCLGSISLRYSTVCERRPEIAIIIMHPES